MKSLRKTNNPLDAATRNDINHNWQAIEDNFKEVGKDIDDTFEDLDDKLDTILDGRLLDELFDSAEDARTQANHARVASDKANQSADNANDKATHANEKGDYAKEQGDYAKEKAEQADIVRADVIASNQDLQQLKLETVQATQSANQSATHATTQGDYAKLQGDTAQQKGNTAEQKGNAAQTKGNTAEQKGNVAESKGNTAEQQGNRAQSIIDSYKHVGDWKATVDYKKNEEVLFNGSTWRALIDNKNVQPTTTTTQWQLIAQRGVDGEGAVGSVNNIQPDVNGNVDLGNIASVEYVDEQIGDIDLSPLATKSELTSHTSNKSNPHNVTKAQIGLSNVTNVAQAPLSEFNNHVANKSNPHSVTKSQIGLSNVDNVKQASAVDVGDKDELLTTAKTNLVSAINEVFHSGNNVKNDTVDALLSVDDSLQISQTDSWSSIIDGISTIHVGDYSVGDVLQKGKFDVIWDYEFLRTPYIGWSYAITSSSSIVFSVAVDNQFNVYSGVSNGDVRKINPHGQHIWTAGGGSGSVYSVAVDSQFNYYTGQDKSVAKYSSERKLVWRFTQNTDYVRSIAVDTQYNVYSAGSSNPIRKINPQGQQVWSFTGHTSTTNSVAVDDQLNVYSGGVDSTVRKINPQGQQVWSFPVDINHTVFSVAVDKQNNVYSSDGGKIRKINPQGQQVWSFTHSENYIYATSIAVDDQFNLYAAGTDCPILKINSRGHRDWSFPELVPDFRTIAVDSSFNVYGGDRNSVKKIITANQSVEAIKIID